MVAAPIPLETQTLYAELLEQLLALHAERSLGRLPTDGPSGRVLRSLSDSGLFEAGAVLVGTHAFVALGSVSTPRRSPFSSLSICSKLPSAR